MFQYPPEQVNLLIRLLKVNHRPYQSLCLFNYNRYQAILLGEVSSKVLFHCLSIVLQLNHTVYITLLLLCIDVGYQLLQLLQRVACSKASRLSVGERVHKSLNIVELHPYHIFNGQVLEMWTRNHIEFTTKRIDWGPCVSHWRCWGTLWSFLIRLLDCFGFEIVRDDFSLEHILASSRGWIRTVCSTMLAWLDLVKTYFCIPTLLFLVKSNFILVILAWMRIFQTGFIEIEITLLRTWLDIVHVVFHLWMRSLMEHLSCAVWSKHASLTVSCSECLGLSLSWSWSWQSLWFLHLFDLLPREHCIDCVQDLRTIFRLV